MRLTKCTPIWIVRDPTREELLQVVEPGGWKRLVRSVRADDAGDNIIWDREAFFTSEREAEAQALSNIRRACAIQAVEEAPDSAWCYEGGSISVADSEGCVVWTCKI